MENEFYEKNLDEQKKIIIDGIGKLLNEIKIEVSKKEDSFSKEVNELLVNINKVKAKKDLYKLLNNIKIGGVNARTYFKKGKFNFVGLNKNKFENHDNYSASLLLYHELNHATGRDNLYKLFPRFQKYIEKYFYDNRDELIKEKEFKNMNKNKIINYLSREFYTKIVTFRKYMNDNNYKISISGIDKLFNFIEKEINKKQNILYQVEESELFYIYENFINNKKLLLIFLVDFVKLEDLKYKINGDNTKQKYV